MGNKVQWGDSGAVVQFGLDVNGNPAALFANELPALSKTKRVSGLVVAAAPTMGATSQADTGGFLPASTTYYYKVTAITDVGETTVSTEVSQATGAAAPATHTVTINWTAVTGATGYKIYRGTTTNTELLLDTTAASIAGTNVTSYVDKRGLVPSGAMPTANTAGIVNTLIFDVAVTEISLSVVYGSGTPTAGVIGGIYFAPDSLIPGAELQIAYVGSTTKISVAAPGTTRLSVAWGFGGETSFNVVATGV